jgi:hypothetical protein
MIPVEFTYPVLVSRAWHAGGRFGIISFEAFHKGDVYEESVACFPSHCRGLSPVRGHFWAVPRIMGKFPFPEV